MCMDHYEINPSMYGNVKEREKFCTRTNGRLENGFMYLYEAFQLLVINASTYTKCKLWLKY